MIITKQKFHLTIPNISKLKSFSSCDMVVNGIRWNVYTEKVNNGTESTLGVLLYCQNANISAMGTCVAAAKIKLVSYGDKMNSVTGNILPHVFDNRYRSGCALIEWSDLFDETKNLVKNDTINLEIIIYVEELNNEKISKLTFENVHKCCNNSDLVDFRFVITNIENLLAVQTSYFTLQNIKCFITIYRCFQNKLNFRLEPLNPLDDIKCNLKMSTKLISNHSDNKSIDKDDVEKKGINSLNFVERLISFGDLLKPENGFVKDNSITVEITVSGHRTLKRKASDKFSIREKRRKLECPICLDDRDDDASFTPCGHVFCTKCIIKAISNVNKCPLCKSNVTVHKLVKAHF